MNTHFTEEYTEPRSIHDITLLAPGHIAEHGANLWIDAGTLTVHPCAGVPK